MYPSEAQSQKPFHKILLISLPAVLASGDNNINHENVLHLGLAYLAAVLRNNRYDVKILDCYAEDMFNERDNVDSGWKELGISDEIIIERIKSYSPDLIGISIPFSCQHYIAHSIAKRIKVSIPDILIVAGGNHVSAVPERIDDSLFDYLIIGEGEYAFLNLIDRLTKGEKTEDALDIDSHIRRYTDHIEQLDELPFPALDLMPLDKLWHSRKRWINMVATRGCVYDCNFCSIHTVMGHTIRRRSVENVLAEIQHWKRNYDIQEIYFEDDNLTANKRWAKELFQRIADQKLGIRFYSRNGIRADTVDRELLILMKSAGYQDFMIAPESGSQRTLDQIIGKKMKLADCEKAVILAREVGLGVNAFFVIGFPDESWEDIQITLDYAKYLKDLGVVGFWVSTATPYPGTHLYRECITRNLIDPDHMDYRRLRTPDYIINHPTLSAQELLAFRSRAMEELAPEKLTASGKAKKVLTLLRKDPQFFFTKLKYKIKQ